jgi:hypothetical protein
MAVGALDISRSTLSWVATRGVRHYLRAGIAAAPTYTHSISLIGDVK